MGCGTHSNGFSTGLGVFRVLRQVSARTYALAPFGSKNAGWAEWLSGKLAVKAVLMRGAKEIIPKEDELLRRWRIVSEKGEKPQMKDYMAYGKKVTEAIEEKWKFLNELVVSEKPPFQAATNQLSVILKGVRFLFFPLLLVHYFVKGGGSDTQADFGGGL